MNVRDVEKILNEKNLHTNEWFRGQVHSILLHSEKEGILDVGCYPVAYNKLFFDTEFGILLIKKFKEPELISDVFNKKVRIETSFIEVPENSFLFSTMIYPGEHKHEHKKKPVIGDMVYAVDKETLKIVYVDEITSIVNHHGGYQLYLDNYLKRRDNRYYCWANGMDFHKSLLENPKDCRYLYKFTEKTRRSFDTVVDFNDIKKIVF